MRRVVLRLFLAGFLAAGPITGCQRDAQPKYVMPTLQEIEGELEAVPAGSRPKKPAAVPKPDGAGDKADPEKKEPK